MTVRSSGALFGAGAPMGARARAAEGRGAACRRGAGAVLWTIHSYQVISSDTLHIAGLKTDSIFYAAADLRRAIRNEV
jgi:hypothetical protein